MSISENIKRVKDSLPEGVALVAVTKTKSEDEILQAYDTGHRMFGENKIQEMVTKWEQMPKDIEWHMIGHVQRNKVKYMAAFVSLIHAVDSLKLLKEINKQAAKHDRVIDCLLQIKIAEEDSKFGISEEDAQALFTSEELKTLEHIRVIGLMGMATFTDDREQLSAEFGKLQIFFNANKDTYKLRYLSMGMSADYPLALGHGSNMVRVGSAIFGARNYQGD
ncbi:MAG: YggS family pyridoxal phosphate-dependent enzyme [Bacteroidetes bacterium]|nr:MAG: YggS family pyridoxal phosphate-dependent enzyme [Bacteroidota bacterium]